MFVFFCCVLCFLLEGVTGAVVSEECVGIGCWEFTELGCWSESEVLLLVNSVLVVGPVLEPGSVGLVSSWRRSSSSAERIM